MLVGASLLVRPEAPVSVVVVGCNHRSADLPLLERLAVPAEELPKALTQLTRLPHVAEAVILSTCNRVEVYASLTRFHAGLAEVRGWLAERGDVHPQDLEELHYSYHDDRAAAHLFAVAGGVDSMVVGEQQIAIQVKTAMETARAEGTARRVLQRLFRQSVRVGRRLRRDTDIARGASSMVDVGLDVARARLGAVDLRGRRVLLVGAGEVGSLTATRLVEESVAEVRVWNRSLDKAERLVERIGAEAAELGASVPASVVAAGGLRDALAAVDLVVCTTGAPEPVLDADLVAMALSTRATDRAAGPETATRPLVLLDLAMPRNVDPACDHLAGVNVVDIADVRDRADRGVTGDVLAAARALVDEEADRFASWVAAGEVEPTIRDLRRRAEGVRQAELERLSGKLGTLDDRQRAAVEALSRGIINTLLHEPTVRLKRRADEGGAEPHAEAVRDLFGLDDPSGD
ncbi:glutamyl-tRNA reductase [Nitriliruptoraceae bacterium ZYF776]|nr:glutamyl-tRNA reductase [Profundirhabdus halotolerans]